MVTQSRFIFILVGALALAACETLESGLKRADNAFLKRNPQTLIDAGATRLNADQARAHVTGNTEFWSQGAVYYIADGQLDLVWHKVKSSGSWEISEDGNVCLTAPTWSRCHHYLDLDGTITTVVNGKTTGVWQVEQGKHPPRWTHSPS